MLRPRFTGAFKKDRKRTGRRGKDLNKLGKLMRRLASEEQLEARFRDHKLSGEWKDFRECHVQPTEPLARIRASETLFERDQLGTALLTWKSANTFYLVLAPRQP